MYVRMYVHCCVEFLPTMFTRLYPAVFFRITLPYPTRTEAYPYPTLPGSGTVNRAVNCPTAGHYSAVSHLRKSHKSGPTMETDCTYNVGMYLLFGAAHLAAKQIPRRAGSQCRIYVRYVATSISVEWMDWRVTYMHMHT